MTDLVITTVDGNKHYVSVDLIELDEKESNLNLMRRVIKYLESRECSGPYLECIEDEETTVIRFDKILKISLDTRQR